MEENLKQEEIQTEENQTEEKVDFEKKIEQLEKEVADWKKEYSIKLADFENYKKRINKDLEEFKKYANEKIILKTLESLDVLNSAVKSSKESKDIDALISGIEMIISNMNLVLKEEGVELIEAENEKYDPYLHQALLTDTKEDVENEVVLEVLQNGYKLKGKVIRPAMVKINKK